MICFFLFKQKTAYEMRISDWSSDVCSSDLKAFRSMSTPKLWVSLLHLINKRLICSCTNNLLHLLLHLTQRLWHLVSRICSLQCSGAEIGRASCRERVCQYV